MGFVLQIFIHIEHQHLGRMTTALSVFILIIATPEAAVPAGGNIRV
jgi:hypothetical protein